MNEEDSNTLRLPTWSVYAMAGLDVRVHRAFRRRVNTPFRIAGLVLFLASLVALAAVFPQILTEKYGSFEDARNRCLDEPCEAQFPRKGWQASLSVDGILSSSQQAKASALEDAKAVCRRATFCEIALEGLESDTPILSAGLEGSGNSSGVIVYPISEEVFLQARDICRDKFCAKNTMPLESKVRLAFLELAQTLVDMFEFEVNEMLSTLERGVSGDEERVFGGGSHHYAVLELIQADLRDSGISQVHFHVVEAVQRMINETKWKEEDVGKFREIARSWSPDENAHTEASRSRILNEILEAVGVPAKGEAVEGGSESSILCSDSCESRWDGVCDDLGGRAGGGGCTFGTDCMVQAV